MMPQAVVLVVEQSGRCSQPQGSIATLPENRDVIAQWTGSRQDTLELSLIEATHPFARGTDQQTTRTVGCQAKNSHAQIRRMLFDCAVLTEWLIKQTRGCPDPESAQAIFDQAIEVNIDNRLGKEMTFEPPLFQAEKLAAITSDPENPAAIDMQIVHKSILKFSRIAAIENSEIYSIKAYQPFRRPQPQITGTVLNNGHNRIVRQSAFGFPGIQGILGDFSLRIQAQK